MIYSALVNDLKNPPNLLPLQRITAQQWSNQKILHLCVMINYPPKVYQELLGKPMRKEAKIALQYSLPIFFAYFPLGIVFGILACHLGISWELTTLMSVLVYAGSVQFVALSIIVNHGSYFSMIFATIFIALRNSFYGLNLLERFNVRWPLKLFLTFGLVDATYALLMAHPAVDKNQDKTFCFFLTFFIYLYWQAGTLLDAIFAHWLPSFPGLKFVLPAFFMVLVIEIYLKTHSLQKFIIPILAAIGAYFISPNNFLLVAILLSMCLILLINYRSVLAR